MNITQKQFSRKDVLKMGLLGSAALLLPLERAARTQLAISDRIPESKLPEPFGVPFTVPPVAVPVKRDATTDYYRMTMRRTCRFSPASARPPCTATRASPRAPP